MAKAKNKAPAAGGAPSPFAQPQAPAIDMAILKAVYDQTKLNTYMFTLPAVHTPMVAQDLVMVNSTDVPVQADGGIATICTPKGIALIEGKGAGAVVGGPGASTAPKAAPLAFALEVGVPIPKTERRGGFGAGRAAVYPFDQMEVGQSFFVPATGERENPALALASSVSSATRRYAEKLFNTDGSPMMETVERAVRDEVAQPDGSTKSVVRKDGAGNVVREKVEVQKTKNTRVFTIRAVDETAQGRTKGARIWRTQ